MDSPATSPEEQHCEIEFNRIRAAAFQRAHFEKDNDARMKPGSDSN
jgi:hypothetical protein